MKERIPIRNDAVGRIWYSDSPSLNYFHRHEELECNLVVSGRASYLLENHRIDLEAHTVAWLFPDQEHLMLDVSDDFALWVMVFRPNLLQQTCLALTSSPLLERHPAGIHIRHINSNAFHHLESICKQAIANTETLDLHNATLNYLLHSCWELYRQGSIVRLAQQLHPAINHIIHLLSAGEAPDDLATLAERVGFSAETISRLFKKQTGVSFTTYRNRFRLERFLTLYGSGRDMTILDAALAAGFGSYAQFYRVFTTLQGQTPSAYRRALGVPTPR